MNRDWNAATEKAKQLVVLLADESGRDMWIWLKSIAEVNHELQELLGWPTLPDTMDKIQASAARFASSGAR